MPSMSLQVIWSHLGSVSGTANKIRDAGVCLTLDSPTPQKKTLVHRNSHLQHLLMVWSLESDFRFSSSQASTFSLSVGVGPVPEETAKLKQCTNSQCLALKLIQINALSCNYSPLMREKKIIQEKMEQKNSIAKHCWVSLHHRILYFSVYLQRTLSQLSHFKILTLPILLNENKTFQRKTHENKQNVNK